jgi:hypothetical protein
MRSQLSFRPELEQSEPRLLLSAGGFAHADVNRSLATVDVARGDAYYLTQALRPTTPFFSLVVTNDTGHALRVTVSATTGGSSLAGNLARGGIVASRGQILLFTNDAAGTFTLRMTSDQTPSLTGRFAFSADEGRETTMAKGYMFPVHDHWKVNTSTDHSNPFKVVVQGTGPDRVLKVVAG